MALADSLPVYKALFTNELYEKQQTNAAIASRIAQSVISSGDFRSYLLDVDRIAAVTPEQVAAALRKYLLEGSLTWVVIGSKDQLLPTVDVDFEHFH
jgi:predicted Zn-dependent peptidase